MTKKGCLDHYLKWALQWYAVMAEINMTVSEWGDCGIYVMELEFAKLLDIWMAFLNWYLMSACAFISGKNTELPSFLNIKQF